MYTPYRLESVPALPVGLLDIYSPLALSVEEPISELKFGSIAIPVERRGADPGDNVGLRKKPYCVFPVPTEESVPVSEMPRNDELLQDTMNLDPSSAEDPPPTTIGPAGATHVSRVESPVYTPDAPVYTMDPCVKIAEVPVPPLDKETGDVRVIVGFPVIPFPLVTVRADDPAVIVRPVIAPVALFSD
jgi:hypothetical protein